VNDAHNFHALKLISYKKKITHNFHTLEKMFQVKGENVVSQSTRFNIICIWYFLLSNIRSCKPFTKSLKNYE
jgi:hypothetical protein